MLLFGIFFLHGIHCHFQGRQYAGTAVRLNTADGIRQSVFVFCDIARFHHPFGKRVKSHHAYPVTLLEMIQTADSCFFCHVNTRNTIITVHHTAGTVNDHNHSQIRILPFCFQIHIHREHFLQRGILITAQRKSIFTAADQQTAASGADISFQCSQKSIRQIFRRYIGKDDAVIGSQLLHGSGCAACCHFLDSHLTRKHAFPFPAAVVLLHNEDSGNIFYISIGINPVVFCHSVLRRNNFRPIGHTAASGGDIGKYHAGFPFMDFRKFIGNEGIAFVKPHLCRSINVCVNLQCQFIAAVDVDDFRQFQLRQLHLRLFFRHQWIYIHGNALCRQCPCLLQSIAFRFVAVRQKDNAFCGAIRQKGCR